MRLLLETGGVKEYENQVGLEIFQNELIKRGLQNFVEIRFFDGRVQMRTTLIDQDFLIFGSRNLHYSSFGEKGVLEFVIACDDLDVINHYLDMFDFFWE